MMLWSMVCGPWSLLGGPVSPLDVWTRRLLHFKDRLTYRPRPTGPRPH
jgi:hypothetical protein